METFNSMFNNIQGLPQKQPPPPTSTNDTKDVERRPSRTGSDGTAAASLHSNDSFPGSFATGTNFSEGEGPDADVDTPAPGHAGASAGRSRSIVSDHELLGAEGDELYQAALAEPQVLTLAQVDVKAAEAAAAPAGKGRRTSDRSKGRPRSMVSDYDIEEAYQEALLLTTDQQNLFPGSPTESFNKKDRVSSRLDQMPEEPLEPGHVGGRSRSICSDHSLESFNLGSTTSETTSSFRRFRSKLSTRLSSWFPKGVNVALK